MKHLYIYRELARTAVTGTPETTTEMAASIMERYGESIDRKSIYRVVRELRLLGCKIDMNPHYGYRMTYDALDVGPQQTLMTKAEFALLQQCARMTGSFKAVEIVDRLERVVADE